MRQTNAAFCVRFSVVFVSVLFALFLFPWIGRVTGLLLFPDHDDPLDSTLALQMYDSNGAYEAAIIEHVKAHAR